MAMSRPHLDELPAHMAVLALVIERPNQTVAWYAQALDERFPCAGFSKPTAYKALPQMASGKKARVRCTHAAGETHGSMDRYEAIPFGHDVFRWWMFRPPTMIPAVRQAIYGRIELARLEDLPQLVRVVREEEAIATDLFDQANEDLRKHEIKKKSRSAHKTRADFEREIHETWLYVGPLHWSSRATLCLVVLERLEEIAAEAGVVVPARLPEHWRAEREARAS
jgi:hypothetical protein